ncbi:hypothetical protein ACS0TY_017811 [Phlomoides rotata]
MKLGKLSESKRWTFVAFRMLESVDDATCREAWKEAVGRSGGIISIWNSEVFSHLSSWHMAEALIVNGLWGICRLPCCIINIYVPCTLSEKIDLCDRVCTIVNQNQSACICIIGDFNSIRSSHERDGRGMQANLRDMQVFSDFINTT